MCVDGHLLSHPVPIGHHLLDEEITSMHESKGMVRSCGSFHFVAVVAIVLFVCLRQSHRVAWASLELTPGWS